ncbi:M56 family metallopeptidase [Sphingobacterium kyonggiense]
MEAILTYILQVNLVIALVFLGYQLLLKGLTFYNLNRAYFVIGVLYAFVYPFLDIKEWFSKQLVIPTAEVLTYLPFDFQEKQSSFTLTDLLLIISLIGAAIFAGKLILQLISLFRIHWYSKPAQWRNFLFRNVIFPITPFSFFNKVYVHQQQHEELELSDIFKHEYIHVKGQHSVDVLLFELVLITCWYNPFVWLMRRAVRQNLEFLTDQQVLDKGVDRQTYQYSLLHVSKQGAHVGISNQFNFKTLKKRIMMMNKKRSSKLELSKYAFILPVLIMAGITLSVNQAEGKIEDAVHNIQKTDLTQLVQKVSPIDMSLKGSADTVRDSIKIVKTNKAIVVVDTVENNSTASNNHGQASEKEVKSVVIVATKNTSSTDEGGNKSSSPKVDVIKGTGIVVVRDTIIKPNDPNTKSGFSIAAFEGKGTIQNVILRGHPAKGKPLMLLDGKEVVDMSKINPNDIESITVLKDKAATSIYGEKAEDGVVLIVSKNKNTNVTDKLVGEVVVTGHRASGKSDPIKINRRIIYPDAYSKFLEDMPSVSVYYLNGKAVKASKISSLSPDKIKEIAHFPDDSATKMFGYDAKLGAISVLLK